MIHGRSSFVHLKCKVIGDASVCLSIIKLNLIILKPATRACLTIPVRPYLFSVKVQDLLESD